MSLSVITVRQLNFYIKSLLEGDSKLAFVKVNGEISNFKEHFASGHLYFTLKDTQAALKCVMFVTNARRLKFIPKDGMKVVCTGRISLYERDGSYQLYAEDMYVDGEGDLILAFEELKDRLEKEGLFKTERKRQLPQFPKKIAVITSKTGAAVKDIFNVLTRRYPIAKVELIPATVQGAEAPRSLISALSIAYNDIENDVIIIGRGGGSVEDLWCFNDEALARKIAGSPIPVISAVGHETDFTICDFVADLRAPTPSAAAELAVPDIGELKAAVNNFSNMIASKAVAIISNRKLMLERIKAVGGLSHPTETIVEKRALILDVLSDRITVSISHKADLKEKEFLAATARLDALSPLKTMLRGYAVASMNGKAVTDADVLNCGDSLTVKFAKGGAQCSVEKVFKE